MCSLIWRDSNLGMIDPIMDSAYVQDDFGNAIEVSFNLPCWYFQEH